MNCKYCKSNNVAIVCHHNNRRLKVPVYVYKCNQCKKRFTVLGEPLHYNHKGNLSQRKHICHYCGEYIEPDNDTERITGVHLECFVQQYEKLNLESCWEHAQDFFAELMK